MPKCANKNIFLLQMAPKVIWGLLWPKFAYLGGQKCPLWGSKMQKFAKITFSSKYSQKSFGGLPWPKLAKFVFLLHKCHTYLLTHNLCIFSKQSLPIVKILWDLDLGSTPQAPSGPEGWISEICGCTVTCQWRPHGCTVSCQDISGGKGSHIIP